LKNGLLKIADCGFGDHFECSFVNQIIMVGNPNYISPEVFLEDAPGELSDIYSAGMIIYHFITKSFLLTRDLLLL
jgi:serine/threonine protein kinase